MEEIEVTTKVILDVVLLLIIGTPILVFKFGVTPFHRGFFCNDESISHPFKTDTISTAVLGVVGLGIPLISMIVGEFVIYKLSSSPSLDGRIKLDRKYSACKRTVHSYLVAVYKSAGAFLVGAGLVQSTTDLMKYSIGRLRPNFISVCQPNWTAITCTDEFGFSQFVEDQHCMGHEEDIRESRLSHPSGHASMSIYCMLYLCFYIQIKFNWRGSALIRHFSQFVLVYMAFYCCMSRISDYKHHWSDVLGGAILGASIAIITLVYISDLLKRPALHVMARKLSQLQTWIMAPESKASYELHTNDSGAQINAPTPANVY